MNKGKVSCRMMSQNFKYLGERNDSMCKEETVNSLKICVCNQQ